MMIRKIIFLVLLTGLVSGYSFYTPAADLVSQPVAAGHQELLFKQPKLTPTSIPTETAGTTVVSTQSTAVIGPETYPAGVNPLTGLAVENPENLLVPPALVSITNFPASARPQAGLSFAPFVFELYIGEGMTRYLALFYGDFPKLPEESADASGTAITGAVSDNAMVGPIRSGRLPYESLRKLFNGFLVMASGSSAVVPSLNEYTNVFGSDAGSINSAMIDVTKLEKIAQNNQKRLGELSLPGLQFSSTPPKGGVPGQRIWLKYAYLNQVDWKYDTASGAYHRYQDHADATNFELITDRINGEALTFENVVVLFAPHEVVTSTIIDVNLLYMKKMPALLFRDGQMYEIFWTTLSGEYEKETGKLRPIRFMDANGEPISLKPGQTWVEVVQQFTRYNEAPDSAVLYDLANKKEPGSGVWAIHWYPPEGAR
ncbi:MAG: hypothetical protein CVU39_10575 [Chloroflexi bacterium HGW-Chloroflexi-10]|nr:MAG: hypothetical protein CVU39_10575 [Chloroflexi bacterium HGW-Chloroflexi-10]